MPASSIDAPTSNIPAPGALTLDHLAYFAADMTEAGAALERLGFRLTPFSEQSHRLQADGPLVSAGTANRLIMFEAGYLEILTPIADTPLAGQLRTAIARYAGLHLVAFGTSAPEADHARLEREGFDPLHPIALQRPISTEDGGSTARFTVVRVPPGTMPEGRIQYCHHRTPELIWQRRWLDHSNGVTALKGVVICAADAEATARRYSRFTGLTGGASRPPLSAPSAAGYSGPDASQARAVQRITTARGSLYFVDPPALRRTVGIDPPALPWIAAPIVEVRDLDRASAAFRAAGCEVRALGQERGIVRLPDAIGGFLLYESATAPMLALD
jgi:Glyoxalase-like domain